MRLFRRGDRGEPVRDIQARLSALGFACAPDDEAVFGRGGGRRDDGQRCDRDTQESDKREGLADHGRRPRLPALATVQNGVNTPFRASLGQNSRL